MMTFEPQDPPEVSTQYCENCHKEAGRQVDDAWLCDVCEKAMDQDVIAYYKDREQEEMNRLRAELSKARAEHTKTQLENAKLGLRLLKVMISRDAVVAAARALNTRIAKTHTTAPWLRERIKRQLAGEA